MIFGRPEPHVERINEYLDTLNFVKIGEKIRRLYQLLQIIKGLKRGRYEREFPKDLAGAEFLRGFDQTQLADAFRVVTDAHQSELDKFAELKGVFAEFNSGIGESDLKRIPLPADVRIRPVDVQIIARHMYSITCRGMEKFYEEKIGPKREPFRYPLPMIGADLKKRFAFGLITMTDLSREILHVDTIQPLTFFGQVEQGKGISQPIPNAHLLILFEILKLAKAKGKDSVRVLVKLEPDHKTQEKLGKDILKIASRVTKLEGANHSFAEFIRG